MAGDKSGSYFLECVIECSEPLLLLELVHGALYGSTNDYAQDNTANFVLQAILRRLSAELEQRRRSSEELTAIEDVTDVCLTELATKEFFPYLILQRGGKKKNTSSHIASHIASQISVY